jgi:hypothetical protein
VFLNFVKDGSHAIALRDFELQSHLKLKTAERQHPASIGTDVEKLAFNATAARLLLAQLRVNLTKITVKDLLLGLLPPKMVLVFLRFTCSSA